jgi:general secretion pathway protein K
MTRALHQQSGAAILAAMLTITLVATFAASALWQQYRAIEVETAERARVQSGWLSTAALDWARLILREDARAGSADHLAEPWAVPLNSTQLSSFLSLDKGEIDSERNTSLSGQIIDLQSLLNVANLVDGKELSAADLNSFARLFELLGLPSSELVAMSNQLLKASTAESNADLMPQRVDQLVWLGLSPQTLAALSPYITLLPQRTPVNLNTAGAEVIFASTSDLSLGDARKIVTLRDASYFRSLADAVAKAEGTADQFNEGRHGVASGFFEVRTTLKLNQTSVEERATIKRDGLNVRVLWRDRGAVASGTPAPPAAR